jgi:O-antigen ligase
LVLVLVAIAGGAIVGLLGDTSGRLIVIALAAVTGGLLVALRFRTSFMGQELGVLGYLGVLALSAATAAVTFNGVRVATHATLSDAGFIVAAALLAASVLCESMPLPRLPWWLFAPAGMLLGASLLAALTLKDPTNDLTSAAQFAVSLVGIPLLVALATRTFRRSLMIALLWAASAAINALVGISDALHLTSIGPAVTGFAYLGRVAGLTVHPNHLAIVCAMALPILLFRLARPQALMKRAFFLSLFVVVGVGVLVAGSRAAIAAALGGLVLMVLLSRGNRTPYLILILLAVMVTAVVGLSLGDNGQGVSAIQRALGNQSVGESDSLRVEYYVRAFSDFQSSPLFGQGFDLVRGAHDIYLQLLQAGGIVALVGFGCCIVGALRTGLMLRRGRAVSSEMDGLAAALIASIAIWLIAGLAQNLIYDRYLYLPIGLLLGLGVSLKRAEAVPADRPMPWQVVSRVDG